MHIKKIHHATNIYTIKKIHIYAKTNYFLL